MKRGAEIARAFQLVEKKFGDISRLTEKGVGPIVSNELTNEHLQALFTHKACAIHVKNFVSKEHAALYATAFKKAKTQNWKVFQGNEVQESSVQSVFGVPFTVAAGHGQASADEYFKNTCRHMREMREACGGHSPSDRIRLSLDEEWKHGCMLGRDKNGQPYQGGIGRVMDGVDIEQMRKDNPSKAEAVLKYGGFCHVDDISAMKESSGVFSANLYLEMPRDSEGKVLGGLEIFPVRVASRLDFYRNAPTLSLLFRQDFESQRRLREAFPAPYVIRPEEGDLVVLCVQRPHSVINFQKSSKERAQSRWGQLHAGTEKEVAHDCQLRVSLQTFMSYSKGKPILLDS
uniref:Uncharacterized protein n=1 Tax=Palpitomonas bilix TaxID=652834 RepID=A0A7S3DGC8_9EUKA|mmetsp:Transcript_36401/g.94669  ORF Transcript_36401/g.94669 Transcript_36401/m.94669 type:complete len:345 (+) Transcript_36401:177-1211(+)